jgi:hypothetical protein
LVELILYKSKKPSSPKGEKVLKYFFLNEGVESINEIGFFYPILLLELLQFVCLLLVRLLRIK